jgi:hypothetical protein
VYARSNSLFCMNDRGNVLTYGKLYVVFPIGKFDVIWSDEHKDLYNKGYMDWELSRYKQLFLNDYAKTYQKGNLLKAIQSKNEIMLLCKKYYILTYKDMVGAMVLNHFGGTL